MIWTCKTNQQATQRKIIGLPVVAHQNLKREAFGPNKRDLLAWNLTSRYLRPRTDEVPLYLKNLLQMQYTTQKRPQSAKALFKMIKTNTEDLSNTTPINDPVASTEKKAGDETLIASPLVIFLGIIAVLVGIGIGIILST